MMGNSYRDRYGSERKVPEMELLLKIPLANPMISGWRKEKFWDKSKDGSKLLMCDNSRRKRTTFRLLRFSCERADIREYLMIQPMR